EANACQTGKRQRVRQSPDTRQVPSKKNRRDRRQYDGYERRRGSHLQERQEKTEAKEDFRGGDSRQIGLIDDSKNRPQIISHTEIEGSRRRLDPNNALELGRDDNHSKA